MPKNPDLVPTVIVDVNGRTTIVHKLRRLFSSSGSRSSGSRIPAPVVAESRVTMANELARSLPRAAGVTDKASIERLGKSLRENYPIGTMRVIREILERGDRFSASMAKHLVRRELDGSPLSVTPNNDWLEITIRNNDMFGPMLGTDDYEELDGLVCGTQNLSDDLRELRDLTSLDKRQVEQFVAVAKAVRMLRDQYPLPLHDTNHPVREYQYGDTATWSIRFGGGLYGLLLERPEAVDKIVDVVIKHQTRERNRIWGLMMDAEGPMAEGAL